MNNPTKKPETEITKFKNNKLASDITNIHKALVVDIEIKKIPEGTFISEILPILTGETISTEFPLLMAAVAGNPFLEVDVVDNSGNVLFRMPALLERNVISHQEASKRGSLQSMMITSELLAKQSPMRAEKYLEHEFNGRGIAANRDEIIKKRQDRWNAILVRYGKALASGGGETAGQSVQTQAMSKPQLDFKDDDLL